MTEDLDRTTLLLHRRTEGVPAELPRPADLRRRAEHGRRTRRTAVAAVAAAVAVVTAIAVMTGGTVPDRPDPVVTPTPSPTTSGALSLRVEPLMAPADWSVLSGQKVSWVGQALNPLGCSVHLPEAAVNSDGLLMGLYRARDGSQRTEYLHPFATAGEASLNFTGFRDRLIFCHGDATGSGTPGFDVTEEVAVYSLKQPAGPLDEVFVGRSVGERYWVAVARDDNIVVVLESTGGELPIFALLETALARAIRGAAGRCDAVLDSTETACRQDAPGVARRPYRMAAEPALDPDGWTAAVDFDRMSDTAADTPGCLGSPQGWGAQHLWRSTVKTTNIYTTWVNEYVLDGGTSARAHVLFDALVARWEACRPGRAIPDHTHTIYDSGFDDLYVADMSGNGAYSVGLARDENVIVVVEVSGYIDRGVYVLKVAMDHAITEPGPSRG